jgi:hypothetical protein
MRVLDVGSHRSVHIWSHRELLHVWCGSKLWYRVAIIIILAGLWWHPSWTVETSCWLLMISRSSIVIWLTRHISLRAHLLVSRLASARCNCLAAWKTCWGWLVSVCVVTWLSSLCRIIQSYRPREYELTLHLCDRILCLIWRRKPEESVSLRLSCLHIIYHFCLVYGRVLFTKVVHQNLVSHLWVQVTDINLVISTCIWSDCSYNIC